MQALLLIDLQHDFLPGGALAVPDGDATVPAANALIDGGTYDLVVATQDWHPADHGSFASQHEGKTPGDQIDFHGLPQTLWPDHCVQDTDGAAFHLDLNTDAFDHVVQKGQDPRVDSYSAFFSNGLDNGRRQDTGLDALLRARGVTAVHVAGLALDYCVKFTALDAARLGYATTVLPHACRAVNLQPNDGDQALEELRRHGVEID